MAKTGLRTPVLAAAVAAAMLLPLAGCAGTEKTETGNGTEVTSAAETETAAAPISIADEDYAAMGMTPYDDVEELKAAAGFAVMTLDGIAGFADYAAEEAVLDNGSASVRYAAGGNAGDGSARRVIIMNSAPEDALDTSDREAQADVLVGEQPVSIAEDEAQSLRQAWWSADGCTYTVDMFNVEFEDFKTLLETLCE